MTPRLRVKVAVLLLFVVAVVTTTKTTAADTDAFVISQAFVIRVCWPAANYGVNAECDRKSHLVAVQRLAGLQVLARLVLFLARVGVTLAPIWSASLVCGSGALS